MALEPIKPTRPTLKLKPAPTAKILTVYLVEVEKYDLAKDKYYEALLAQKAGIDPETGELLEKHCRDLEFYVKSVDEPQDKDL